MTVFPRPRREDSLRDSYPSIDYQQAATSNELYPAYTSSHREVKPHTRALGIFGFCNVIKPSRSPPFYFLTGPWTMDLEAIPRAYSAIELVGHFDTQNLWCSGCRNMEFDQVTMDVENAYSNQVQLGILVGAIAAQCINCGVCS